MLLMCTFDAIFVLLAIVRELFGDFVRSAWRAYALVSIGIELHELSDVEFVHLNHRLPRPNSFLQTSPSHNVASRSRLAALRHPAAARLGGFERRQHLIKQAPNAFRPA